jgi:predicted ATPase
MIRYIYLKNFKAFQEAEIYPAALNIFSGLNGMGKSTFLQSLLLLRQSFLQKTLQDKGLLLNGNYLSLGKGKDVFSMYPIEDSHILKFEIEWIENHLLVTEFKADDDSDLLPNVKITGLSDIVLQQSLFSKRFQYLSAERISPKSYFPSSAYDVKELGSLGNHGEFTVHFIAENGDKPIFLNGLAHPEEKSLVLLDNLMRG